MHYDAAMPSPPARAAGVAIVLWAVGGVLTILAQAIVRLLPRALEPLEAGQLGLAAGLAYLASIVLMAYSEGYRGFQRGFSPRVVVRAFALAARPSPLLVVLAPLMAMGLIHANRRRKLASWILLVGIVGLILVVRQLDQPWRGAVDAGVVVGLGWGMTATIVYLIRALRGRVPEVAADLPEARPTSSGRASAEE